MKFLGIAFTLLLSFSAFAELSGHADVTNRREVLSLLSQGKKSIEKGTARQFGHLYDLDLLALAGYTVTKIRITRLGDSCSLNLYLDDETMGTSIISGRMDEVGFGPRCLYLNIQDASNISSDVESDGEVNDSDRTEIKDSSSSDSAASSNSRISNQ